MLIATHAAYPDVVGGMPIATHQLAEGLVRRGWGVEVHAVDLGAAPAGGPGPTYPLVRHRRLRGPWDLVGTTGNPWPRGWSKAIRATPADIVHVQSHLFLASWAAARAARRSGKALVVAVHGVRARRGPLVNALQEAWLRTCARPMLRGADAVLTLSAADTAEVVRYGAPPQRIVQVPNGVDLDVFRPGPDAARVAHQVLWAGRHVPEKGVDVLLRAWPAVRAAHPQGRLVLAGDGPTRAASEALARRLGLEGVVFADALPPEGVAGLMRQSSLFVLPSLQEGFPLVVAEAMACALPVVALPDLAPAMGTAGVALEPGDPGALGRLLADLLADPAALRRMGQAGRAKAAAEYGWDAVAQRTELAYAAALAHAAGQRQGRGVPAEGGARDR